MAKEPRKSAKRRQPYGIGEWFGRDYLFTIRDERAELVVEAGKRRPDELCRFRQSFTAIAPRDKRGEANLNCNKPGGVCCLRQYRTPVAGQPQYSSLVTTCPVRFSENGTVFAHIASKVLAAPRWRFAKEIDFLNPDVAPALFLSPTEAHAMAEEARAATETGPPSLLDIAGVDAEAGQQPADDDENARSVGRIDMVLAAVDVNGKRTGDWCAVELQAVYFQGSGMASEWAAIRKQLELPAAAPDEATANGDAPPFPAGNRRPDFRSSGPKRLLPQLQIKVPSLRRWGKKMAVVVDAPFFSTFGPMKSADHVSNADIVWCVVGYQRHRDTGLFKLCVLGTYMTTLEEAVIGLTAGKPMSQPDFEASLWDKLGEEIY